ncbi:MAG: 30S ribosomal protein S17 [Candidatus Magasanikbacteria bacterium]|nr:30S ribosomal protein S17 [Candidatus Magasanikbacteria bacterium]
MTNTAAASLAPHRTFQGAVISAKAPKTITVRVDRFRLHPKYHKKYRVSRKYQVHDERGEAKAGQLVTFAECRPLSKTKRWRLVKVLTPLA